MELIKLKLNNFKVPSDYKPYGTLNICNNKSENVNYIFIDNGFIPLLIGEGKVPRVWLFAKISENEYIELVVDNKSKSNGISVMIHEEDKKLSVEAGDNVIKRILEMSYEKDIKITLLDLRLIGININGDADQLNVGGNKLVNNTVKGANSFIGVGK